MRSTFPTYPSGIDFIELLRTNTVTDKPRRTGQRFAIRLIAVVRDAYNEITY